MQDERKAGYRHVVKYIGLFGSVQGLNMLMGVVRNKVAAVLLGPDGLGLVSLLNTWQGFSSQATNLGLSFGSIPRLSQLYEQGDSEAFARQVAALRLWCLVAAALGFVFCVLLAPLFCRWVFPSGDYVWWFAAIAPAVAMIAVTGGELAVLKASRHLGALAKAQAVTAIVAVVVAVPLYWLFRWRAIVPVIVLSALVSMVATIAFSFRYYPWRKMGRQQFAEGRGMVQLGVAVVVAATVGQLAELLLRAFLTREGQLDAVGLYNAAYTLTITYSGLLFASLESDYYPRLSACGTDKERCSLEINRQAEVLLLLATPLLTVLMIVLPIVVPLLYSGRFAAVVPMAQVAVLAVFFKALSLPLSYIPLTRHDSRAYMAIETAYWLYFLVLAFVAWRQWGLWGLGLALAVAHVVEWLVIIAWSAWRYGYRCSSSLLRLVAVLVGIALTGYAVTILTEGVLYWVAGILLVLVSIAFSLWRLMREKC